MPIRFPTNDLTNQYISNSYQNIIQQYLTTGSLEYILDGYGNVIFSIPSSSIGNTILTQDQTASYALNAVTTSLLIITQSFSSTSISSSWASQSLSSSYSTLSNVSLISEQCLSASISDTASFLSNGNYQITSSQSITSSYSLTSSYLVYPSSISTTIGNSINNLISLSNTTYNSIFITYILNDSQNFRAGNIVVLYNTQSIVLTETSTTDIGDSSGLLFSASLSASNVNLLAINGTTSNYTIKYHFDVL